MIFTLKRKLNMWCTREKYTITSSKFDQKLNGKYIGSLYHILLVSLSSFHGFSSLSLYGRPQVGGFMWKAEASGEIVWMSQLCQQLTIDLCVWLDWSPAGGALCSGARGSIERQPNIHLAPTAGEADGFPCRILCRTNRAPMIISLPLFLWDYRQFEGNGSDVITAQTKQSILTIC